MYKWIRFNSRLPFIFSHDTNWLWPCQPDNAIYIKWHMALLMVLLLATGTGMVGSRVSGVQCTCELFVHIIYYMLDIFNGCTRNQTKEFRYRIGLIQLCNELVNKLFAFIRKRPIEPKRSQALFRLLRCFLYLFLPTNWLIPFEKNVWRKLSLFFFKLLAKQI